MRAGTRLLDDGARRKMHRPKDHVVHERCNEHCDRPGYHHPANARHQELESSTASENALDWGFRYRWLVSQFLIFHHMTCYAVVGQVGPITSLSMVVRRCATRRNMHRFSWILSYLPSQCARITALFADRLFY
jgi:hypothetical protein